MPSDVNNADAVVATSYPYGAFLFTRRTSQLFTDPQGIQFDAINDAGVISGTYGSNQMYLPEPGVWAMLLAGFGGIGAVLRRKRSAAICAAA